jgi:hypothetical protein
MLLTRKSRGDTATPPLRRLAAQAATMDRRAFLRRSGLAAGAVAAVATAGKAAAPAAEKQAGAADTAQGYRVTAHIEKYYKTTEV